jgi:hypothetical protein
MTSRPTPRDGWRSVPNASAEGSLEATPSAPFLRHAPPRAGEARSDGLPALKPRALGQPQKTLMGLPPANLIQQLPRRLEAPQPNMEATAEVSLADVSLASLDPPVRRTVASDRTEDVSLHDFDVAALAVANDAEAMTPEEPLVSDLSPSAPTFAPSRSGKRWFWAVGALALLLGGGGLVALGARGNRDLRQTANVLAGEPGAVSTGVPASAAATTQAPVPSTPAPADSKAALLAPAAPDEGAKTALEAAQPSVGAADTAPDEEAAELEAVDGAAASPEGLNAAQAAALKRADGLVAQASALRKRRKLEPAVRKYQAALAAFPGHPRALYGLVQVSIQKRDGKQAVQLAQELVRVKPDQVSYLVLLGDAYKAAGKSKDARETWQSAARQGSAVARKRLR